MHVQTLLSVRIWTVSEIYINTIVWILWDYYGTYKMSQFCFFFKVLLRRKFLKSRPLSVKTTPIFLCLYRSQKIYSIVCLWWFGIGDIKFEKNFQWQSWLSRFRWQKGGSFAPLDPPHPGSATELYNYIVWFIAGCSRCAWMFHKAACIDLVVLLKCYNSFS